MKMTSNKKPKIDLEAIKRGKAEKREQVDPFGTNKTRFDPTTGDLYISTMNKNGIIRRQVVNLFGD